MGRNEPCACGSGKKYKKCCLSTLAVAVEPIDFAWKKLRQIEGSVVEKHLLPYVLNKLPKGTMKLTVEDFMPDFIQDTGNEEIFFDYFFIPWFLFNWISCDEFEAKEFDVNHSIALNYLKKYKDNLSRNECRFIERLSQSPYSFYCVLDVELEKKLTVKDILLGTTHILKERQGTHSLKRGDIVFSRILTLDDQSIFVGMCPFTLPVGCHTRLIKFRAWLTKENRRRKLTKEALCSQFGLDILDYFFELLSERLMPSSPILLNTDGDLMVFSKSYFALKMSPEKAFRILLPLTLEDDPNTFLESAEKDSTGTISYLEFPWLVKGNKHHKHWDNTVMGNITLFPNRLTLETNSAERTEQGKILLQNYLGGDIHFQQTLLETPQQKLRSLAKQDLSTCLEDETPPLPEIQEQMEKMVKNYWENWFDNPIPALNNKTPREAAKTQPGRERLEALLLYYEREDLEKNENSHLKVDINYLKKELQLM